MWGVGRASALVVTIALSASVRDVSADPLARRPYLGLRALPLTADNAERLRHHSTDGVWVQLLTGDSPVSAAGMEIDDIVVAVNDTPTPSLESFIREVDPLRAGDHVAFKVARNAHETTVTLNLPPLPREVLPNVATTYGSFMTEDGVRLRSLVTTPADGDASHPGILILQGHVAESVEVGGYNVPRELAVRLGRHGYAAMRYDRRGIGDSEGETYLDTDWTTEVMDAESALAHLAESEGVDASRLYILGTGLGATVAASVAERHPEVKGVITWGAVGRPWLDYIVESGRAHRSLVGEPTEDVEATLGVLGRFFVLLTEGFTVEEILDRHPDWRSQVLDWQGRPYGRNGPFFAQLGRIAPSDVFGSLGCSVLIGYGEADFVALREDQDRIEQSLRSAGNRDHVLFVVPKTDHAFGVAEGPRKSFENWNSGQVFFNDEAMTPIVTWLDRRTSGS